MLHIRNTPAGAVIYHTADKRLRLVRPSGELLDELSTMEAMRELQFPLKCKYVVTGRCNQRCYHCYVESQFDESGLGTADALRVIDRIAEAGTLFLELFGGEVGVRKDFVQLLHRAVEHGLVLSFFTNGTLFVDDFVDTLPPAAHFAGIIVSLLAGTVEDHDRLARRPGAWRRALAFAERLRDAGYPVSLTVSVTTESAMTLRQAIAVADEHQLPLRTIFNTYAEVRHERDKQVFALDAESMVALGRATPELARRQFTHKPCFGGTVTYSVNPHGQLTGCDHVTDEFGSVLERPIREIWASRRSRTFAAELYTRPERCGTCPPELKQYCTYCPATAKNAGVAPANWVDYFCGLAERKRAMHDSAKTAAESGAVPLRIRPRSLRVLAPAPEATDSGDCGTPGEG